MRLVIRRSWIALVLLVVASPASAQWTRVADLPATDVFSVWASGDTLAAGMDTCVFVSTDGAATWRRSARPVAGVAAIDALWIRNGRLYGGTFGQGVFTSDDLGATWQAFNEGLVGGVLDSQLDVSDLVVRGDSLYAATEGAGVYVRNLGTNDSWHHFGDQFEPNQASNVNALALGGTRLVAAAGGNGSVFHRDPGESDWTISWLDNVGLRPGLMALAVAWNGNGWVVGTTTSVFRSSGGAEPWTLVPLGLGGLTNDAFAARGTHLFAAFSTALAAVIEHSGDDGATWEVLESLPGAFVYRMAMVGNDLFAGRGDGLWRRSTATVSVPRGGGPAGLRLSIAGPQPVRDRVRFRFTLAEAGAASLDLLDVTGRRVAVVDRRSWPAGTHILSWDTSGLVPGVYEARLVAAGRQEVARIVRVR